MTVLAAVLVAAGLFVAIVSSTYLDRRRVKDLGAVLDGYSSTTATTPIDEDDDLRKAFAHTGKLAERALAESSLLARIGKVLARSEWTLSAGEFIAVSLGAGLLGLLVGLLIGSPIAAVLLAGLGLGLPYFLVSKSVNRRKRRFEEQLPDVLDLLGASLQSGAGVPAALELVVTEAAEPAASEFARVLSATRLGSSLVEALEVMADRLGSRDLVYTVQAIAVQQRTGGKLADVLAVVAEFMRGRFEVQREIQALTAEGRLSAYILGGLPFGIAILVSIVNPDYLEPLYTTGAGVVMLILTGIVMSIALFFMSRIIKIEV